MIEYIPSYIPTNVIIYGVGGTGSRLVPLVAQFLKTCSWVVNPVIYLVDFDRVEEKNLLRQNFIRRDVDKFKSEVLAERYSKAYDIPILPITEKVTLRNLTTIFPIVHDQSSLGAYVNSLHILCVDSPEARREIISTIAEGYVRTNSYPFITSRRDPATQQLLVLDSGNENDFGQVVISDIQTLSTGTKPNSDLMCLQAMPKNYPLQMKLKKIPLNISYYSDMVSETTLSCADLDQTMAINCLMANTLFSVIQNIYYCKPIPYHRLNVSLTHGTTPEYITPEHLFDMRYPEHNRNPSQEAIEKYKNLKWATNLYNRMEVTTLTAIFPDFFTTKTQNEFLEYTRMLENLTKPKENLGDLGDQPKPVKKRTKKEVAVEPELVA